MNKQKKDGNISWTDYTWNPIRGLCPVGCKYCYARAMYKRFKLSPKIRFTLDNSDYVDDYSSKLKLASGTKVFICSTFEIFHPSVKKEWRDIIFLIIEKNPDIIFQILTKMPENIDRPMPDNVWLGVSVTGAGDQQRMAYLCGIKAKTKFISWEPLLANPLPQGWRIPKCVNWAIIGKLSGQGKKHDPEKWWIKNIVKECKQSGIPIFLKNNLIPVIGKECVMKYRDFPKE